MKKISEDLNKIILEIRKLANNQDKLTGFCIGNTRKINNTGLYFTPIRKTNHLIAGSAVVYSENEARELCKIIDGQVDYVLVDSEKKISASMWGSDGAGNIERVIRETIKQSNIITYKGNDITVNSIENFIVQALSSYPRGVSGKKAIIIGAGNIGSKLALRLVERGMSVGLMRRDSIKLKKIVTAINIIKPIETIAKAFPVSDGLVASKDAHVLVGLTEGSPIITKEMVMSLAPGALLIDGGKGCFKKTAVKQAKLLGISIYRSDIRPSFGGYIDSIFETEKIIKSNLGRITINGISLVSSGLLADANEVVVDSITKPQIVFGLANGKGDFIRAPTKEQKKRLQIVCNYIGKNLKKIKS